MRKHRVTSSIYSRDEDSSQTNLAPEERLNNKPTKRNKRLDHHSPESSVYTKAHNKRIFVKHDYKDHANDPIQPINHSRGHIIRFPSVLHRMLDEVEEMGLSHIVSWCSHGRAFVVKDQDSFFRHVMPQYFKQSRFSSFLRQLAMYGFVRLSRNGCDHHAYYHEYFLRGREDLSMRHMKRTCIKGTAIRYTANPESEPDFLAMPPVGISKDSGSVQQGQSSIAESIHSFAPDELPPVFEKDELSAVFQETLLSRPDEDFEVIQSIQASDEMPSTPFQCISSYSGAAPKSEKECEISGQIPFQGREVSMSPEGQYPVCGRDQQTNEFPNGNEGVELDRLILTGLDVGEVASV